VYVADEGRRRIQKFDKFGILITAWGTAGSGPGQFYLPSGVDVDRFGNVLVADYSKIHKFTSDGTLIATWPIVDMAYKVEADLDGNFYVVEPNNYRMQKFDNNGNFLCNWNTDWMPHDAAVDSSGYLYVVTSYGVLKYAPSGVPSQLPDLTITSIRPVQVVFEADIDEQPDGIVDLVLGKPTAFEVTVRVDNRNALPSGSIPIRLTLENHNFHESITKDGFVEKGPFSEAIVMINPLPRIQPQIIGQQQVHAIVDPPVILTSPNGIIEESDETNNSTTTQISVRQVGELHAPYVFITQCLAPWSCYAPLDLTQAIETQNRTADLIRGTYPIQGLVAPLAGSFRGDPFPTLSSPLAAGMYADLDQAWRIGRRTDPNASNVITLVPPDYFRYHTDTSTFEVVGWFPGAGAKAVMSRVDFYSGPAHELGHTFRLPVTVRQPREVGSNVGEEYSTAVQGNCAAGFWVDENKRIDTGFCFMGSVDLQAQNSFHYNLSCSSSDPNVNQNAVPRHLWIDSDDYRHLFRAMKQPGDPQVISVSGLVFEDGSVALSSWYVQDGGLPSTPEEGEYSLAFVDSNNSIVYQVPFAVDFDLHLTNAPGPIHTGVSIFAFAVPAPEGVLRAQIEHGGIVTWQGDLLTKLLLDGLEAIPDRGFVADKIQRRNALRQKILAVENMLSAKNYFGALQALRFDLAKITDEWLLNDYSIESPLEFTKQEFLILINEAIRRLEQNSHP
jgi:hypothetical protein